MRILNNGPVNQIYFGNIKENKNTNVKSPDLNEHSGQYKIPKFILIATGIISAGAAVVASFIGRNPQKAAKFLKGSSEIIDPIYKKASEHLKNITDSKNIELSSLFTKDKERTYSSRIVEILESFEKSITENNNTTFPKDALELVKSYKEKNLKFLKEIEENINNGKLREFDLHNKSDEFFKQNKQEIEKLLKLHDDIVNDYEKFGFNFDTVKFDLFEANNPWAYWYKGKIGQCPKELLPKEGILYHGTQNPKEIYKNGFSPFVSRQLSELDMGRELGAGIYATADKNVAASFAGIKGKIIPLKLDSSKIAIVNEYTYQELLKKINELFSEEFLRIPKKEQSATMELLFRKIFKDAGYDAVYTPRGVRNNLSISPSINTILNLKQSQFVIFSPEKVSIASNSIKERIKDFILQIKRHIDIIKAHKNGLDFTV